jgi:hypothetical protein
MVRVLSLLLLVLILPGSAIAIDSLTAAPNPATAGQSVTFSIGTSFATIQPGCSVTVTFGDQTNASFVPAAGSSIHTLRHAYAAGGTYQAAANSAGCIAAGADPPAFTTVSVLAFGITRLELAFADHKSEAIVRRNEQGVRARATIATVGSGLLQGYWEVDGRALTQIDRQVIYGQTVTIETPSVPQLPTFDPGTHLLRLVITSPAVAFPLPTLVYTVTPEEARPIQLQGPLPEAILPFAPASFIWHAQAGAENYELTFLAVDGSQVFSALTKQPDYRLGDLALRAFFAPGTRYLWQVRAFDTDGRPAGGSQPAPFRFQEQSRH